ncbi:MAG TPA: hypothetical protein VI585_06145 [Candidatus Binatia bacterium]
MFIETYYDDRAAVPGSTSEPMIPYPEMSGKELTVWQEYLPIKREIRNLCSPFSTIPDSAIAEIKKATRSFERIEIWSRARDPMAVGVIGEEKPRYFSIVRWGDAELTLAQVKRRLWIEKWLLRLTATGGILGFLVVTLAARFYGG